MGCRNGNRYSGRGASRIEREEPRGRWRSRASFPRTSPRAARESRVESNRRDFDGIGEASGAWANEPTNDPLERTDRLLRHLDSVPHHLPDGGLALNPRTRSNLTRDFQSRPFPRLKSRNRAYLCQYSLARVPTFRIVGRRTERYISNLYILLFLSPETKDELFDIREICLFYRSVIIMMCYMYTYIYC